MASRKNDVLAQNRFENFRAERSISAYGMGTSSGTTKLAVDPATGQIVHGEPGFFGDTLSQGEPSTKYLWRRNPLQRSAAGQRALTLYSRTAAGLELKLYDQNDQEVDLPTFWTKPFPDRPYHNAYNTVYNAVFSGLLHGNAFIYAPKLRRGPGSRTRKRASLFVLDPYSVQIDYNDDGIPTYRVTRQDNSTRWIPSVISSDEMCHINFFPQPGFDVGKSPSRIAWEAVALANSSTVFAESHLSHSATPTMAFEFEGEMSREQVAAFRRSVVEQLTGPENAGVPYVFDRGAQAKPISHDPQASQLVEQRQLSWQEIGLLFGIPPMLMMVNTPGAVSYASAWASFTEWLRDSVQPLLLQFEIGLSQLFGDDYRVEFDLQDLIKGDPETRQKMHLSELQAGAITVEQYAEYLGHAVPLDKDYMAVKQGTTYIPLSRLEDPLDALVAKKGEKEPMDRVETEQMIDEKSESEK